MSTWTPSPTLHQSASPSKASTRLLRGSKRPPTPERPAHPSGRLGLLPAVHGRLGYGYAAFLDQLESADPRPSANARVTSSNERELRAIVAAADELFRPSGGRSGRRFARLFDLSARLWHRCAALGVSISARICPARPTLRRPRRPLAEHHHVAFEDIVLGSVRASARRPYASGPLGSCSLQPSTTWGRPSPRTSAGQRRAARRYFEFVECHGLAPDAERSILLFLADAATQRRRHSGKDLAASTVKGLAAHVWRELKLRGLVDPTRPRSFMYSTAWRGMQARLGRPVAQRRAFLPGDLRAWLTTPSFLSRAPPRRLRDATVLATGIAGFLRGAELVALRVDDLEFSLLPSPRIALHIRRSKTDRTAHGAVVYLTPGKCPASCPVRLLCAYVASTAVQAAPGTPLFPRLSDPAAAITVGFVRRLVKEAAEAIGYDPTDFSGHSLRRALILSHSLATSTALLSLWSTSPSIQQPLGSI
eukprot:tig00021746_g23385.t1